MEKLQGGQMQSNRNRTPVSAAGDLFVGSVEIN
jgi:hypothetical protein